MNRRAFLTMFATGSVGMTATDKLGYLDDLTKWVLSPSKAIFVPPEPRIATDSDWKAAYCLYILAQNSERIFAQVYGEGSLFG